MRTAIRNACKSEARLAKGSLSAPRLKHFDTAQNFERHNPRSCQQAQHTTRWLGNNEERSRKQMTRRNHRAAR